VHKIKGSLRMRFGDVGGGGHITLLKKSIKKEWVGVVKKVEIATRQGLRAVRSVVATKHKA